MLPLVIQTHVGADGVLQLELPEPMRDTELTITVEIVASSAPPLQHDGFLTAAFFAQTYGALAHDPLIIDDHGIEQQLDEIADSLRIITDELS